MRHIDDLLQRITEQDGALKAYCDVRRPQTRADAARLAAMPATQRGPLYGLGGAIKEVVDVAGHRCGWGSEIHANRIAARDAPLVATLRQAGAVILGTVASTEYAMARAAATQNPYDALRTPGASSSGSAAAVAARLADFAIGTQTIGSGIRPAAYCGVIGFKPTHGWTCLDGCMALSPHLDHAVVFARELEVVERVYCTLATHPAGGHGATPPRDQSDCPNPPRVALLSPWFEEPCDERLWQHLKALAQDALHAPAALTALPERHQRAEEPCLETILSHDMWAIHRADYEEHRARMSPQLTAWLERGRLVSGEDYAAALALRQNLIDTMWQALPDTDVLVSVATTGIAPLRTAGTGSRAPQRIWSLLGMPTLAYPIGMIDGLPIAAQLIARPGEERALLRTAGLLAVHASPHRDPFERSVG